MGTCLPRLLRDPLDVGLGPTGRTSWLWAGQAEWQGGSAANGQRGAFDCLALEALLFEFGGQIGVINVFQGLVALSEDVAGQPEEEDHRVDANDGEDVPGSAGPVWEPQGPGGVGAVPALQLVPQQVPQGGAGPGLVGGSQRSALDP